MYIYKITNIINNKIYIGKYQGSNKNYFGSGTYLKSSINKYGKSNFIKEIIEDNIADANILAEREIYWISFYNSTNKSIGYNLSTGGDGSRGFVMPQESKNKISCANKGKQYFGDKNGFYGHHCSQEHKEKLSRINKGYKHTEEAKAKISLSSKNRIMSIETKNKISKARLGIGFSEEHKKKLSESATRRASLGISNETREKCRMNALRRWHPELRK